MSVDYCGDTYSGDIYVSKVRYLFTRDVDYFFDKKADKRFSKGIQRVRVICK